MANWIFNLEVADLWRAYEDKVMSAKVVGKTVAERLRALSLPELYKEEQEGIASTLETEVEDADDLDVVMDRLWDLGDTPLPTPLGQMQRKLIWVNTFGKGVKV